MQEIPYILTEWKELNSLLYAPLSATKRVQYTCIAISTNFIVLGATSGSVYLFTREPCVFQQLIPLSEGAVYRAQISPDEKILALATVRGSVCLVVLKPSIKLVTISTEHIGEKVTCLCWNENSTEVYAGDESGKISVSVLSTFTVNGMFQSPSCALMNLDSKIVQMNFASNLLLVSTLNRCYICDTVLEQYKQIGNKPRDGEFGACFLKTHNSNGKVSPDTKKQDHISNVKKVFSISGEVNNEIVEEDSLPKVYCARPGSRIWEVTANGVVIKTHQFREALAIPPLSVFKPSIGKLFKLKNQDQAWPIQSINFAQISVINHKYLFSYTLNGLYIFDPENAKVILWNDEFPDISMAHIIGDKIYLMTSSGVFHCLTLASIDSLILKLYDKKLYKECLEMCQILRPQLVTSAMEDSCDIDIKQTVDLSKTLLPIISVIKSNHNTQPRKLESGIVIVNSGNRNGSESNSYIDKRLEDTQSLEDLDDLFISLNTNGTSNAHVSPKNTNLDTENHVMKKNGSSTHANQDSIEETQTDEASSLQKTISNVQADLESIYLSISTQMKPNITETELENIIKIFVETLDNLKNKYEVSSELQSYLFEVIRSAELHYCNSLLENLPLELLSHVDNQNILQELVKIFIDVNSSKYIECSCGFPYPIFGTMSKPQEPKFLEVGKTLLDKLSLTMSDNTCLTICNQIPFMWREYLSIKGYAKQNIPDNLLKQCLQIRDNVVLSILLPTLNEQQWKVTAQCFESIKNGRCINCGKSFDNDRLVTKDFCIDWSSVTHFIIKKQDPSAAMFFLYKVNENLSQVIFDKSLYQSIIFSTILNHHGIKHAVEFDHTSSVEQNSISSPKILKQVEISIEKDLDDSISKDSFGAGPHHWGMRYNLASSTCPCCTLSLQTPVLLGNNGIALFPCGHAYHVNCMIQKKVSRCNLHDSPQKQC